MTQVVVTINANSSALTRGLEDAQIACSSVACRRMARFGFHREALALSDFERHMTRVGKMLRDLPAPRS